MTRFKRFLAPLAGLMLIVGLAIAGSGWSLWADGQNQAADDEPKGDNDNDEEKSEVKKIPLEEVYTTTGQEGMKWAWHRKDAPDNIRERVGKLSGWGNIGASNIFLVRGRDFDEAVRATHRVFYGSVGVETPALPEQLSKSKPLWLVAYFGHAQSGPQEWVVRSVTIEAREIRVEFVRGDRDSQQSTDDVKGYFFWIPLEQMATGAYTLTLFGSEQRSVELMRRVTVPDDE